MEERSAATIDKYLRDTQAFFLCRRGPRASPAISGASSVSPPPGAVRRRPARGGDASVPYFPITTAVPIQAATGLCGRIAVFIFPTGRLGRGARMPVSGEKPPPQKPWRKQKTPCRHTSPKDRGIALHSVFFKHVTKRTASSSCELGQKRV